MRPPPRLRLWKHDLLFPTGLLLRTKHHEIVDHFAGSKKIVLTAARVFCFPGFWHRCGLLVPAPIGFSALRESMHGLCCTERGGDTDSKRG